MIEKQESFITNLMVKRTYLQDIRIFSLFSTIVKRYFVVQFPISNSVLKNYKLKSEIRVL